MYKLRFYKKTDCDAGNLLREEFFDTLENMKSRYNEVFIYELYVLNPTAWELQGNGKWRRLEGL